MTLKFEAPTRKEEKRGYFILIKQIGEALIQRKARA